jgi:hypothetical protein
MILLCNLSEIYPKHSSAIGLLMVNVYEIAIDHEALMSTWWWIGAGRTGIADDASLRPGYARIVRNV